MLGVRKKVDELVSTFRDIVRENERLKDENDKLRELLLELYEDQCDECDRWKYIDRMRELGIEVD